jgi:hypothetical protein
LLGLCAGIEGALDRIDFTGRELSLGFGSGVLLPHALPIAHDGFGNFWAVDLQPGSANWGPIHFCCHDAPVMLVQAATVQQFVSEVLKMYIAPRKSLIDDVHEDRLFDVWRKNPGVIAHANAVVSSDADIRTFAAGLDSGFELIDLRDAPTGMGLSWGRYGPNTEVKRFDSKPILPIGDRKRQASSQGCSTVTRDKGSARRGHRTAGTIHYWLSFINFPTRLRLALISSVASLIWLVS